MRYFDVPYANTVLKGTIHGVGDPRMFFVHGASLAGSVRNDMLRQHLAKSGIASAAFDFIGAGETGGDIFASSLADRLSQARAVIDSIHIQKPLIIVGTSMGADTALRLTQQYPVSTLILFVPAFYSKDSFAVRFSDNFDTIYSRENKWKESDTWDILREFVGSLLVIGAQNDEEISHEIYDAIDEATPNVKYKELYIVPRAPHRILQYLGEHREEFARAFERIYHRVVTPSG
ncbi:MAG: alpha/beta hydrolase [Candidatus Uhrbacteria bacterium]|nr:alpha/beta hydrolase [Candidatus Uhrbacteria bacterium]